MTFEQRAEKIVDLLIADLQGKAEAELNECDEDKLRKRWIKLVIEAL